jgi:hypothetical protein
MSEPVAIGKYMIAYTLPTKPQHKTLRWRIASRSSDATLGTVAWYPAWRQYTFDAAANTTFNAQCLDNMAAFLRSVRNLRRIVND